MLNILYVQDDPNLLRREADDEDQAPDSGDDVHESTVYDESPAAKVMN